MSHHTLVSCNEGTNARGCTSECRLKSGPWKHGSVTSFCRTALIDGFTPANAGGTTVRRGGGFDSRLPQGNSSVVRARCLFHPFVVAVNPGQGQCFGHQEMKNMQDQTYTLLEVANGKPIKLWTQGVPVEPEAREQLMNTAKMPFIFKHMAVMPDVHLGKGSTIGSVIPTMKAIIPAAVGVDIGCGMVAIKTNLTADKMPDNLHKIRQAIEEVIPVGFSFFEDKDLGREHPATPSNKALWKTLNPGWEKLTSKYDFLDDL